MARSRGASSADRVRGEFTPQAQAWWESIPGEVQDMLLANVFCSSCFVTSITDFRATVEGGFLILRGTCALCGKDVCRAVEPDEPHRAPAN